MHTITTHQAAVLRSIVSDARQTVEGDTYIYGIEFYDTALDILVWHAATQQEEQAMHTEVFALRDRIRESGVPCDPQIVEKGTYRATYHINPNATLYQWAAAQPDPNPEPLAR